MPCGDESASKDHDTHEKEALVGHIFGSPTKVGFENLERRRRMAVSWSPKPKPI